MTTTTSPAGAPPAPRPAGPPPGRMARLIAALGPHATALRVAGGVLTLIGTLLPWATFVLNSGPYPDKATLQYFVAPFGVTGFRLQLLLFGIAALVLTLAPVPARGRLLRGLAWGIIGIAVVNGLYITVEGGGLVRSPSPTGRWPSGPLSRCWPACWSSSGRGRAGSNRGRSGRGGSARGSSGS